jgi:hypothetical protein
LSSVQAIAHLQAYAEANPDEAAEINAKIMLIKEANIRTHRHTLSPSK